jgi:opacity protein-like surface antigen
MITPNLSAGIDLGWNVFYERKDYDTYTVENVSLSGVQYRYNNQFPILVNFNYIFRPEQTMKPYFGMGIGTMYSRRNTEMGQWSLREEAWHFALKPEIGLMYQLNGGTHFKVSGKYNTGFSAGDLDTQSYFSLNLGLVFMN